MIHCENCKFFTSWGRPPEVVAKYGQAYECSKGIIDCPVPSDFCSKAEVILKCNKCGKRFGTFPNFCPNCGQALDWSNDDAKV